MQSRISELEGAVTEPIAIVGIGTRMPGGGDSPATFWKLLEAGVDAVANAREGIVDIGNGASAVNMYMGHLVWTLAYGKVRWLGGSIGRFDFFVALGAGAVDEAGSAGLAGSGGFGMKFFFNDWFGMRLDVRDQVRSVRGPLGVERIVNDITAVGGLSVFIPFES